MKNYTITGILLMFVSVTSGQGKFFGGSGDGFAFSEASVTLPVRWLSFDVKLQHDHARLTWTVVTSNISPFTIEISNDGTRFEKLAEKEAAGNSPAPVQYSFDDVPRTGIRYYRISWAEPGGQVLYSKIVVLVLPGKDPVQVYYDVSGDFIYIQKPVSSPVIEIFSADGKLQKRFSYQAAFYRLPVNNLPAGIYILKISGGPSGQEYINRFVKGGK